MNDLIQLVTPLTRGIIWLVKGDPGPTNPHYAQLDYLLDGLLTANVEASPSLSSRVILGQNFGANIHVLVINDLKASEVESYLSLFAKTLTPEEDIIVIDETSEFDRMKPELASVSKNVKLYF